MYDSSQDCCISQISIIYVYLIKKQCVNTQWHPVGIYLNADRDQQLLREVNLLSVHLLDILLNWFTNA